MRSQQERATPALPIYVHSRLEKIFLFLFRSHDHDDGDKPARQTATPYLSAFRFQFCLRGAPAMPN